MKKRDNKIQAEISELKEKINRNKFVNDMYWRERSDDNRKYLERIYELEKLLNI